MEEIAVTTVEELREVVRGLGYGVLFRGQTSHYLKGGNPSVVTSFDRKGCIPSQMLKWSRYAESALEAYIGPVARSLDFMQALLQHYGWRSFYVDCSASAAVSAWFASHVYSDKRSLELCEDCGERPVMLSKRMARYDYADGDGHLYAFDLANCAERTG
ncbi:FRG domain-containing protein, partial [Mesorhizobium sp. M4B.F.Ca.ET.089.01.1.1]|uniref:FRG domain-containing protein n=2 Tax=Mesorhizobium TaxID=68287 RepID=UPI000FE2F8B0